MWSVNGIFWKPQCKVYREASIFYFNNPFSGVPSFSKISKPTGYNQQIGKDCFVPPLTFKISLRNTSFRISLNSLGFYLSRMLVEFSDFIFQHVWEKFFSFWYFNFSISRKCVESMHFYSCLSFPLKTPVRIFWRSVSPPRRKGLRVLWFALLKFHWKIWRWLLYISLFTFCMICNFSKFSKCDGLTIL